MGQNVIREFQRNCLDWVVAKHAHEELEKRAEYFSEIFENYLEAGSQILDVGGGWGFYHGPLTKRGHQHVVLDVVKPGYQKSPLFLYEPSDPFPFPDKSFDVSMLVTVMHHISEIEPVLKEIKRVTRKTVIVVEDLFHHPLGYWWTRFRDQLYNFEFFGHPCQFKTREGWVDYFKSLGFSLKDEQTVFTQLAGLKILNGIMSFQVPHD